MSDYVAQSHWYIRTKQLGAFVSPEALEAGLTAISTDELSPQDELALEAFKKAMERRRAGKSDDDTFALYSG